MKPACCKQASVCKERIRRGKPNALAALLQVIKSRAWQLLLVGSLVSGLLLGWLEAGGEDSHARNSPEVCTAGISSPGIWLPEAALGTQPQGGMAEIRGNPAPGSQKEPDKKDRGKPESGRL